MFTVAWAWVGRMITTHRFTHHSRCNGGLVLSKGVDAVLTVALARSFESSQSKSIE
jgi:hypothetical protein